MSTPYLKLYNVPNAPKSATYKRYTIKVKEGGFVNFPESQSMVLVVHEPRVASPDTSRCRREKVNVMFNSTCGQEWNIVSRHPSLL